MLAILEFIALTSIAITLGCYAFWATLQLLDWGFKFISFAIVKIFIDRSATYGKFNVCWNTVKRNN